MKLVARIAATAFLCLTGASALARAPGEEGLVAVEARQLDKAWLLPGADFRSYRKVLLKSAEVAFQKDWLRSVNSDRARLTGRVTEADALEIVKAARSGFDETWARAFKDAGFEVVTDPGEGVLEVTPRVVNLYVNAPDVATGATRTYTVQAGEATLELDVRDSRTGTLLGRVSDRRETIRNLRPRISNAVTNRAEFEQLFATWARIAASGLKDLAARSPLPEKLTPGERIPKR